MGNLTIRGRIWVLLAVAIIPVLALGIIHYSSLRTLENLGQTRAYTNAIIKGILQIRNQEKTFVEKMRPAEASQVKGTISTIGAQLAQANAKNDSHVIAKLITELKAYSQVFQDMSGKTLELRQLIEQQNKDSINAIQMLQKNIISPIQEEQNRYAFTGVEVDMNKVSLLDIARNLSELCERLQLAVGRLMLFADFNAYKAESQKIEKEINFNLTNFAPLISVMKDQSMLELKNKVPAEMKSQVQALGKIGVLWQQREQLRAGLEVHGQNLVGEGEKFLAVSKEENNRSRERANLLGMVISGILILFLCIAGVFMARSIVRPLQAAIAGVQTNAEQVASGSELIAAASQQLAQGSAEQASALEETSASLEEMASMTGQNADNAHEANTLMNDTGQVVEQANHSMTELTGAMKDISAASGETAKIIKTIDEIAFQTNLLALNAAVEAARAGEAGAGFAVVADEVRNLAMRAAEAARNTSSLIENTVTKVTYGTGLVDKTAADFLQVAETTFKAKDLVAEIAAASQEQAQGVEQINKAVVEMEKVTQQNAAGSQESAGASQELSSQSDQMKEIVAGLVGLVGGKNGSAPGRSPYLKQGPVPQALPQAGNEERRIKKATEALMPPADSPRSPEQIIPMDEDSFHSF